MTKPLTMESRQAQMSFQPNAYPDADENPMVKNAYPDIDENPNKDETKTIRRGGLRRSFPVDPEKEHQDDTTKPRRR